MGRSFANQAPNKESHPIHPIQELPGSALTEIGEKISPSELLHIPKKVRSSQKTKDKDTELQLATGISEPDWQE